ncbi:hypothetical protein D3C81_1891240 [compost metagenome]
MCKNKHPCRPAARSQLMIKQTLNILDSKPPLLQLHDGLEIPDFLLTKIVAAPLKLRLE